MAANRVGNRCIREDRGQTGQEVPEKRLDAAPPARLRSGLPTLADHLGSHGFATAAFYANPFFAFGLAFEVPIATVLMVWAGFTTPAKLAAKRAYVLLGAFVVGMFLTPPDVISQTLLAVPVYLLYELGIFMSRLFSTRRGRNEDEAVTADN